MCLPSGSREQRRPEFAPSQRRHTAQGQPRCRAYSDRLWAQVVIRSANDDGARRCISGFFACTVAHSASSSTSLTSPQRSFSIPGPC
jgi:hypothetical protein